MPTAATARRRRAPNWLVAVLAVLGVATLLYPTAARWTSDRRHAVEVTGYADEVDRLPDATGRALLDRAHAYNATLPVGALHVPDGFGAPGGDAGPDGSGDYRDQLAVPGTDVVATVSIPGIDANLPVRHGVDEHTLARGLGHLPGSSLPVGGPGTHTVLTGHSGLVDDVMLDRLGDVRIGDVVVVTVLGATLRYEVDEVRTVTPDDTSALRIDRTSSLLTLVTCTPIGVNSHRLLVRAHQVGDPAAADGVTVPGTTADPGFPWWALVLAGTVASAVAWTRRPARPRGRHRGSTSHVATARRRSSRLSTPTLR